MHPQIQNHRYENNIFNLKECIHKYKTTGMKIHFLFKGMHPQIQNHRYENYTFYLKECIHKYKTTGMKTTLFIY
jgi:phosphopantetheinyl transferase (holo-ACP synthase)